MKLSFQKTLTLFFATIFVAIIVVSVVSYHATRAFKDTTFWVKHTQTVLDEAEHISSLSKDLQLESGGYYFTADSNFLSPYSTVKNEIPGRISILKKLTADNISQQRRIHALHLLINDLINFSDISLRLRRKNAISNSDFSNNVQRRKLFRSQIAGAITAIRNEEKRLLILREVANKESADVASKFFYILTGTIFILLVTGFLAILHHFNKRKLAEQRLRESNSRFHLLLNNIKDVAIIMTDDKGNIMNWYSSSKYLKASPKNEIIGKPFSLFYTAEDITNGEPKDNLKIAAEKGSYETQGWRVRKDGSKFWADIVITAIYDEKGKVQGFTKVIRDYTLQKKAADGLKKALKKEKELGEMKSNFVSMASHEFRTPLSSILSSAALISRYTTAEQQDKRERHINRIKSSVSTLNNILEEFLSLEKIEEGKVDVKLQTFNLRDFTEALSVDMKSAAKSGQIINYTHHGNEFVKSDPAVVRLILTNLTSNAFKYSSENSPVTIYTRVSDGTIILGVKDQGMGISNKDQQHLFERFFRGADVGNIQGTGLGLHIIKQYLNLMNGSIKVHSEVGKGSEFVVEINNNG